ncbi:MAG: DUF563 domain-containing protein, partial [Flavobacterium sp.]
MKKRLKKPIRRLFCVLGKVFPFIIAPDRIAIRKSVVPIHEKTDFDRTHPIYLGDIHQKFLPRAPGIKSESEPTFINVLFNARVFLNEGYVLSHTGDILFQLDKSYTSYQFLLNNFFFARRRYVKGKSLLIAAAGASSNYFHWMTDALPKLAIASKGGYNLNCVDQVIVSNDILPFQAETLLHIGIKKEDRVSLARKNYLK